MLLTAAKEAGVRRVVVTSSVSAIIPSPNWPADKVKNEDFWTDEEYCKRKGVWYPLSKTLAEKAAWKFAEDNGVDIVVVNPGTVLDPIIPPAINASMMMILRLLQGCSEDYEDFFMGLHIYWYMRTKRQLEGTCASKLYLITGFLLLRWLNFTPSTMCLGNKMLPCHPLPPGPARTPADTGCRWTGLSFSGFEDVLLAIYSTETKSRNGKPVRISILDLSQPSLYHSPRRQGKSSNPIEFR